jgi:hypothetical protein
MEQMRIADNERFARAFFCANIDMFYLGPQQSPIAEESFVDDLSMRFMEGPHSGFYADFLESFDIEDFFTDLFGKIRQYKSESDVYMRTEATKEEKILIGSDMKRSIQVTDGPTEKQLQYLESFCREYEVAESDIDEMYNRSYGDSFDEF